MRRIVFALILLVPTLARADKVFTKGPGETWDCATDAVVTIKQDKGTFGLIGECKKITVNGKKNVLSVASVGKLVVGGTDNLVEVEEVDTIATSGARNQVHWTKAKTGDKPKVTKGGRDNKV